jgi:uncharacterized membrane protein
MDEALLLQIVLVLHIGSAMLLAGNLITSAFWKVRADRSGNLEAIAMTSRAVLLADYAFTLPGLAVLLLSGIVMVGITSWSRFQETWLAVSLLLLILTALIWLLRLLPLELRMRRMSREAVDGGALDPAYARVSRQWAMFGGIATTIVIVILFLMVIRPA